MERMPVLDEATYSAKHEMGVDGHHTAAAVTSEPHANGYVKDANGIGKQPAATSNLMDLLSFMPDEQQPSSSSKSSGDALLDLLGSGPMGGSNTTSGTLCSPPKA